MQTGNVSLDLMEMVEKNILPRYNEFDKAHNMSHVVGVIRRSLDIARRLGADLDMAYTIAAYHDLGLSGPRAIHHLTSGKILKSDARLKRWFSAQQIEIMKEAVEDHRASSSHTPRSLYGKIVAEADRDLEPAHVFRRTIQYGLEHYPEKSKDEHWERFLEHMENKYSPHGYIKLWIPQSPNVKYLKEIAELLEDKQQLRNTFEEIFKEETSDYMLHT